MPSKMSRVIFWTACSGALALAALAGHGGTAGAEPAAGVDSIVADWPAHSKLAARALAEQYGAPSESSESSLTWRGPGAWKRTVLHRSAAGGNIVEQVLVYAVPAGKIAALRSFDARVHADRATREFSVRSESPTTNFLLANLAYEIVGNLRTVPEARAFYDRQLRFSEAGKTSDYLSVLRFAPSPAAPGRDSVPRLGAPTDLERAR
jgi:hypothetical protein